MATKTLANATTEDLRTALEAAEQAAAQEQARQLDTIQTAQRVRAEWLIDNARTIEAELERQHTDLLTAAGEALAAFDYNDAYRLFIEAHAAHRARYRARIEIQGAADRLNVAPPTSAADLRLRSTDFAEFVKTHTDRLIDAIGSATCDDLIPLAPLDYEAATAYLAGA